MSISNKSGFLPYILLTLTVLFWSGNFVLGRGVHTHIPPVALAFWRWTTALVILLPFAIRPLIRQRAMIVAQWKVLTVLAIFSVTNFNTFIYLALHSSTAVNTILINAFTPVLIVCFAWVVFRDRLSIVQGTGVVLSLAGLLWIISRGKPSVLLSVEFSKGDLWTFAAACSWAIYTILLRKRPQGMSPIGFLSTIIIIGLVFLLPVYLWEIHTGATLRLTPVTVGSVLYVAMFPSVLAYIFWNRAVQAVGANGAGIFMHLMPVFGIILAAVFLGERLEPYHLPGIGLIFFGIFLTTSNSGKPL